VTGGADPGIPEIRIEPEAREHIAARGGTVTLRGSRRHGCCGGTAFVPVAEMGAPDDPDRFRSTRVAGVTVFLEKKVAPGAEPLVIGLDRLWRWQRLRVEGTAIWM
jgi:hypothetical protein